jgi:hypothetical protein
MRAADKWDSARFSSLFLASGLYCSQAFSTLRPLAANAKPLGANEHTVDIINVLKGARIFFARDKRTTMKTCFVISPIGEQGSETRKRSDLILKYLITPAVEPLGYSPLRADQISEPGLITSQVIQHIVEDSLVIADLTDRNPNVFYELAIRHAIKKPLIQIIKKGEQIPFDVAGTRTIPVDHIDLESVEDAKKEIARQIGWLEKKPQDVESPITVALELQLLRQSDKPEERSLADVVASLSEIKSTLQRLPLDSLEQQIRSQKMIEELLYRNKDMLMMMDRLQYVVERYFAPKEDITESEKKSVKK